MLTEWFRSLQESETARESRMAERVAECVLTSSAVVLVLFRYADTFLFFCRASITSQKQVDEWSQPQAIMHNYYLKGGYGQETGFTAYTCMNSYFKGRQGGAGSSFKTCRYYSGEARKRRDRLIKEVAEEDAAAAAAGASS